MNKIKFFNYVSLFSFLLSTSLFSTEKAIICVPIADLIGQPIHTLFPKQSTDISYNMLPVCWKDNALYACPRLHQLLYNDIVDVLETKGDETCIQISQLFYTTHQSSIPHTTYWTHTKNLCLLNTIANNKIDINHIPQPIRFDEKNQISNNNQHIVTLIEPHYDPITQLTFSVGTRFICVSHQQKAKKVKVFVIHYKHNKETTMYIPAHKCIFLFNLNPNQHIKNFVDLLKSWAHQKNYFIPYVWGGASFSTSLNEPFKEVTKENNGHTYSFFEFENDTTYPKNGFDCSGLISRAAQICNIPYFYKNTTTIGQYLQPLTPEDTLINGDLILIKGHVMIVSDMKKDLLIEARSYGHGYGKVHEIPLNKVFDSIETYNDLCNAFFNNKELKRKDNKGTIRDTFKHWKILKIMSVYKN